jgi:sigma-B regulation protein RsbU (phosphoserine phosphatase)
VCIPARGISGDYYDILELADGRLVFTIADISGKGISAAILMANLQAVLRTLTSNGGSPPDVCARLNYHLHQVTDDSKFATFFYSEWTPETRLLRYVNAGHNPPILVGSCPARRLDRGGLPLGLFPDSDFQMGEVVLRLNDLVVLYSDGITEAVNQRGEEFGERRLQKLIEQNSDRPLAQIQDHVLEAVHDWSGDELEDDLTLLLVRATRMGMPREEVESLQ